MFFTPRAMLWNIKTLGFKCWLKCLLLNARASAGDAWSATIGASRA